MTNAEKIRAMDDEELNSFLFSFKVDCISDFLKFGSEKVMGIDEQLGWLKQEI